MTSQIDPLFASATQIAKGLRDRAWSSSEVLEAHLARIELCNPALNALVVPRVERARAEAAEADRRLARGGDDLPALLGVPCTVKEFLATEGMPHTGGLASRRQVVASYDAVVVERIKAAGAVIMGLSNVPEGGLWSETVNTVYGRTNSPWDTRRTPGGSSGGEGALVAAGCSPFGLGSDVGGSVRIPAALCGVAGHKPSGGTVSNVGHYPANSSHFLAVGPLARRVEDLELVLRVIAGASLRDPDLLPWAAECALDPSQVSVWVVQESLDASSVDVRRATLQAADVLRQAGAEVQLRSIPAMKRAFWIWLAMMGTAGFESYAEILGDGRSISAAWELVKRAAGRSDHTVPPLLIALFEQVNEMAPVFSMDKLAAEGHELRESLQALLGETGVLLLPTMPRPSPRHHGFMLRPWDAGGCGIFNVTELPATTVPVGLSEGGLPIGVQVVGAHRNDLLTLRVARWIEQELGGWTRAEPA